MNNVMDEDEIAEDIDDCVNADYRRATVRASTHRTPPAWKTCPECDGDGKTIKIYNLVDTINYQEGNGVLSICSHCHGTGRIPNRLTPEQYIEWKRAHGEPEFEPSNDAPVWVLSENIWMLGLYKYHGKTGVFDNCGELGILTEEICIIAHPEHPRPEPDWRPEK